MSVTPLLQHARATAGGPAQKLQSALVTVREAERLVAQIADRLAGAIEQRPTNGDAARMSGFIDQVDKTSAEIDERAQRIVADVKRITSALG